LIRPNESNTQKLSGLQRLRLGFCAIVLALFAIPSALFAAESLDTVIIDAGYDKQTKVAVVPFRIDPRVRAQAPIEGIVEFDLQRSGQFEVLEASSMLSLPTQPSEVLFRDWKILGQEFLVIGNVVPGSAGGQVLNLYVFDVVAERLLAAQSIAGSSEQWRDMAHKAADIVFEQATGIPGAFSTRLMYVLASRLGTGGATFKLEISDSDGERVQTLHESNEPILSASWAPNGREVAYVSFDTGRSAIYLHDLVANSREKIAEFPGINSAPRYSPDGKELAMVLSKDGNPEIYVMNLATRSLRRMTQNRAIDTEPSFSPDGKMIAFTSDRGGKPQIYQLDARTGKFDARLTNEGDYNARVQHMPDGKHLVFVHRKLGVFHIAWQSLAGDDFRILTQTDLDESPSVAPNGAMVIYATQIDGRGILAVVSVDGRVKYRLPSSDGDVREPAWSPYLRSVVTTSPLSN